MRANLVLSLYRKGLEYELWSEERAEWYWKSLIYFVEQFVRPALTIPDFHRRKGDGWYWLLCRHGYYVNLTAREHGKSSVHSIFYPLWRICCDRGVRVAVLSNTMEQAKMFLSGIKAHLESNPYIKDGFAHQDAFSDQYDGFVPEYGRGWAMDTITVRRAVIDTADGGVRIEKDATVVALGMGSPTIGRRVDFACYDDCIDDDNSATEFQCEKTKRWFEDSLSMIVRDGQCVVVGSPKTYRDLYQDLLRNRAFEAFQSPAVLDGEKGLTLWDEKWPFDGLMRRKQAQGTVQFNRNYLLQVMSDEDSHFPMPWFDKCFDHTLLLPVEHHDGSLVKVTGVDPAIAGGRTASKFAAFTVGCDRDGRFIWLDIYEGKGLSPAEQKRKIVEIWSRYDSEVVVENNGVQAYLIEDLPSEALGMKVLPFFTGQVKQNFDVGIPSLSVLVEQGRNVIPRGDERAIKLTDTLISQMHYWPRYDDDDVLMAYWMAISRLKTLAKHRFLNFTLPPVGVGLMGRRDVDFSFMSANNERLLGMQVSTLRPMFGGAGGQERRRRMVQGW